MKKLLSIALLTAIIICASACTKKLSPVSSEPTCVFPPPNTSAPLEVPPTTEATTKPDESEKEKDAAFSAYLEQLQSHSDWFTERYYYTAGETKPIAVYDVDGNGIPELLYVHPAEDQSHGEVHFSIYTYANESLQKLYEDYIFSLAGAEPGCFIFIGNDSKLYSSSANGYNSALIRYDYDGYTITPSYLAQSKGRGTSDPESVIYHKNGAIASKEEFITFTEAIRDSAATILMLTTYNTKGLQDISMSYAQACTYLGGETPEAEPPETKQPETEASKAESKVIDKTEEWRKKYAWKKPYLEFLNSLDDSQMSGYQLVFVDEDTAPELLAIGASHIVPSYLCWVQNGTLCKAPVSYSGFCYYEKQNLYFCAEGSTGKGYDYVRRINGSEAENIHKGVFCTVKGNEYYTWDDVSYPNQRAYEAAKSVDFNTAAAKKVTELRSLRDIRFKITDFV